MIVEVFTMRSDRRHQTNIAISSWTVACIQWYDFFVYGTAATLVFPAAFFPSNAPLVGTLLSFTTFGVGFIARPLGGLVFGHIGDTVFNACISAELHCPVSVHYRSHAVRDPRVVLVELGGDVEVPHDA
jgi:MFS family permease